MQEKKDAGLISGLGRPPAEGNPLQYSCLENPMDRGAWRATVCGAAQRRTRLKQLSTHARWSPVLWHPNSQSQECGHSQSKRKEIHCLPRGHGRCVKTITTSQWIIGNSNVVYFMRMCILEYSYFWNTATLVRLYVRNSVPFIP